MTSGLFPGRLPTAILPLVDHQPIAEWLPERYRNVLDRISDLEAGGRHAEADRIRRTAIRAYSRRWNDRTASRLDGLAGEAERILATPIRRPRRVAAPFFLARRPRRVPSGAMAAERPTA